MNEEQRQALADILPAWLVNLDPATFAELVAANIKPTLPAYFHNVDKLPALFDALAAAQAEYAPIVRDKKVVQKLRDKETRQYTGQEIVFFYAELAQILSATVPALSKHGLTFTQPLETLGEGQVWLNSILAHKDGGMLISRMPIPGGSDIKDFGKNITYLRRYAAGPILGVSSEDDADQDGGGTDDDGGGYGGGYSNPPPAPAPRAAPARRSAAAAPAASKPAGKPADGTILPNQVKFLEQKLKALKLDEQALAGFWERMEITTFDTTITLDRFTKLQHELDRLRDA